MKLDKKKKLVSRILGVGKTRVAFDPTRIDEIKEAITRSDIINLIKERAIIVKPTKGKRKKKRRKGKRRKTGRIKKKIKNRKREYIIRIRKIRKNLKLKKAK